METKNQKFRRLATNRTNKILSSISLLGNLSNTRNYDYSEKEISNIFKAIDSELRETKNKFKPKNKKNQFKF